MGMASTERLKIKETNGGCCGQKEYDLPFFFMEACGLEVEEELSTLATQYHAAENQFERFRSFLELISRFDCGNYFF